MEWKAISEVGVTIKADGSIAATLFSHAGSYSINATFGNVVVSTNVHVIDSVYNPVINSLMPLVNRETLNIMAIVNDSSSVGKPDVVLTFVFTTSNKYNCLNNFLLSESNPLTGTISFAGVFTPDSRFCSAGEKEAQGAITLTPELNIPTHSLGILLGGTTYKGYYYVLNKQLYIHWSYNV